MKKKMSTPKEVKDISWAREPAPEVEPVAPAFKYFMTRSLTIGMPITLTAAFFASPGSVWFFAGVMGFTASIIGGKAWKLSKEKPIAKNFSNPIGEIIGKDLDEVTFLRSAEGMLREYIKKELIAPYRATGQMSLASSCHKIVKALPDGVSWKSLTLHKEMTFLALNIARVSSRGSSRGNPTSDEIRRVNKAAYRVIKLLRELEQVSSSGYMDELQIAQHVYSVLSGYDKPVEMEY